MKSDFALIILALFTFSSCGGSGKNPFPIPTKEPLKESTGIDALQAKVRLDLDSPEGLALVLSSRGYSAGTCTGVMVAEDLVLTHNSCFDHLETYEDCSKDIGVTVKTFSGSEWRTCKKLQAGPETGHTLIELSEAVKNVRVHGISRKGIGAKDELTLLAFDTVPSADKSVRAKFKAVKCHYQNHQVTADIPKEKNGIIPMFTLNAGQESCSVTLGNNGAPIKNKNGDIVALALEAKNKELEVPETAFTTPAVVSNIAFAANLSCSDLQHPLFDKYYAPGCEEVIEADSLLRRQRGGISGGELNEFVVFESKKLMNELPRSFKYELKINASSKEGPITFLPTCMMPLHDWPREEYSKVSHRGFFGRKKYYSTSIPTYAVSMEYGVDEKMNLTLVPKISPSGKVEIEDANISNILKYSSGSLILRGEVDTELHLGLCP